MRQHLASIFALILSAVAVVSISAERESPVTRGVTPTGAGEFVWHDLVTSQGAESRRFYAALFDWTFESGEGIDPGYTIIKQGEEQLGGIVQRRPEDGNVAQWLTYVVVPDVDRTTAAFRKAGGRVFREPLSPRRGLRVSVVADAQGAALGLANRGPAVLNASSVPGLHRWLWMDYVAKDSASALEFYSESLGFTSEIAEIRGDFTYYLLRSGQPRAGLFRSPWANEQSLWLPYVRVADPASMMARVSELGGTVVVAPQSSVRNGSMAVILDPGGAPLALQKFPFREGVANENGPPSRDGGSAAGRAQ